MNRALVFAGRQSVLAAANLTSKRVGSAGARALSTKSNDGLNLIGADQSMATQKLFHKTSMACLALTPIALVAHPSALSMPVDICLSVLFPLHAHIGMNWIITDYVPGATPNGGVRMGLMGLTAIAIIGLLKCSVADEGLVGTLKATWADPEELKKKKEA